MAELFKVKNGAESLIVLTEALMGHGIPVSPRGKLTYEIRNAIIEVDDPTDVTMQGMGRGQNLKLAVAEALQLIGGFTDPGRMTTIAPNMKAFLNGGAFHGAYGPRIRPQLAVVVDRLRKDHSSRQAVMTIWNPQYDGQHGVNDLPCTLSLSYQMRDGQLHATTHMRSNDVWWGWTYDLFQFTQLQCTIANMLGVQVGTYVHHADSLHIYEDVIDQAANITYAPQALRLDGIQRCARYDKPAEVGTTQLFAEGLFYGRDKDDLEATFLGDGAYLTETEEFFLKTMQEVPVA